MLRYLLTLADASRVGALPATAAKFGTRDQAVAMLKRVQDQVGRYLVREILDLADLPGRGWADYKWPSPINNKIQDRSSCIEKMGGYFVGVGIYKQLLMPDRVAGKRCFNAANQEPVARVCS